jgi:hypothetical protein
MTDNTEYVPCPHCGESIKKNARACPHCGSDEKTGWSVEKYLDDIDLDDDFDYEETLSNEFPRHSSKPHKKISWIAIAGAIVLFFFIAAMLMKLGR